MGVLVFLNRSETGCQVGRAARPSSQEELRVENSGFSAGLEIASS
jgi:hypothetical protein